MRWRWIFFHPVNTKLISDGRNGIFPFNVAQLYICESWVQFWMQGVNENHCRSVFTASTQQNFSYLGLEEGTDWCWGGWGSERQPTVKWNGINHISDFCGSIWGFFGLCRDTPCIASQLWWEKAAGGAGALQEHCPSQACREFRGQFFGRPQKWNGGIWGVSWEPFTIWTFSRWALRLCQQSQRGCLLPLPSQGMGNHSVFSSSELNCDVLPWSVPIFLKDLPNEGESKICKFDKQESGTGRQSVLENGWNHLEKENGRNNECKVPLLGCSNRWQ